MDSVDKAMEREFGDFYDSFTAPPKEKSIKQSSDHEKDKKQSEQTDIKSKSEEKKRRIKATILFLRFQNVQWK